MARSDLHLVGEIDEDEQQFRLIMRRLAGGVSVITAGRGGEISGMTVTSLTSLSASPPRLLVSVNKQASSFALIERHGLFGVNILRSDQLDLAKRFSSSSLKGRQRFDGIEWSPGVSGDRCLTAPWQRWSAALKKLSSVIRMGLLSAA